MIRHRRYRLACLLLLLLAGCDLAADPAPVALTLPPQPLATATLAAQPSATVARPTVSAATATSTLAAATSVSATSVLTVNTPVPYLPQAVPASRRFLYVTNGGTLRLRDSEGVVDKAVSAPAAFGKVDYGLDFAAQHMIRWSPDGRYLIYANSTAGGLDLVEVEKAMVGEVDDALIHLDTPGVNRVGWSGDSRYLAISQRAADGDGYELAVVGTNGKLLANAPTSDLRDFAWSPSGAVLAYSIPVSGTELGPPFGEVYTLTVAGEQLSAPSLVSKDGEHPQWSPDGKLLAYWRLKGLGGDPFAFSVRVVAAAGTEQELGNWSSTDQPDFAPTLWNGGYIYANLALDAGGKPLDDLWSYRKGSGRAIIWSPDAKPTGARVAVIDGYASQSRDLLLITIPGSRVFNVFEAVGNAEAGDTLYEAAFAASNRYLAFNALDQSSAGGGYRAFTQRSDGDFAPLSLGRDLTLAGWGANANGSDLLLSQSRNNNTFYLATAPDFKLKAAGQGVALGWQPVR